MKNEIVVFIFLAGTSLQTAAPAATTAFSPMVTPGSMVAAAPIQAFRLLTIGLPLSARLSAGAGMVFRNQVHFRPGEHPAFDSNASDGTGQPADRDMLYLYNTQRLTIIICYSIFSGSVSRMQVS